MVPKLVGKKGAFVFTGFIILALIGGFAVGIPTMFALLSNPWMVPLIIVVIFLIIIRR